MQVRTTRFGTVEIAEDRVICFPKGLLGFSEFRKYCLLEPAEDSAFFWLQSLDDPSLAFVVTDPSFVPDYSVPDPVGADGDLGLSRLEDAGVRDREQGGPDPDGGNLQGPAGDQHAQSAGEQFVLAEAADHAPPAQSRSAKGAGAEGRLGLRRRRRRRTRLACNGSSAGGALLARGRQQAGRSRLRLEMPPRVTSTKEEPIDAGAFTTARQTIMIGDDVEITVVDIPWGQGEARINARRGSRCTAKRCTGDQAGEPAASRDGGTDVSPMSPGVRPGLTGCVGRSRR